MRGFTGTLIAMRLSDEEAMRRGARGDGAVADVGRADRRAAGIAGAGVAGAGAAVPGARRNPAPGLRDPPRHAAERSAPGVGRRDRYPWCVLMMHRRRAHPGAASGRAMLD